MKIFYGDGENKGGMKKMNVISVSNECDKYNAE